MSYHHTERETMLVIDSGALPKECLAQAICQLGSDMFPNGSPVDSVYNGCNINCARRPTTMFCTWKCVQHACWSECCCCFKSIRASHWIWPATSNQCKRWCHYTHKDIIIDNDYTGIIDDDHKEDIVGTIMVNLRVTIIVPMSLVNQHRYCYY